jgi:hypothetical protein
MSEGNVQTRILFNLKRIKNSEWEKATVTNNAGSPDIKGHIEGYYVAIEVKDGNNRPSTIQDYRINETKKKGGIAFWTTNWANTLSQLLEASEEKGFYLEFIDIGHGEKLFI